MRSVRARFAREFVSTAAILASVATGVTPTANAEDLPVPIVIPIPPYIVFPPLPPPPPPSDPVPGENW
jgi:hypothetical protein